MESERKAKEAEEKKRKAKEIAKLRQSLTKSTPTNTANPKTTNTKESILVWQCQNDSCHVWKRITTYEETLLSSKKCSVCGGVMEQVVREI
jgi:hypothetical protein